jgi:hypothetical protein
MSVTLRWSWLWTPALVLMVSCVDGVVVEPPQQGGNRTNPLPCILGQQSASNPWNTAGIVGNRTNPENCPFIVFSPRTFVTLATELRIPKQTSPSSGFADFWGVWSMHDGFRVAGSQGSYYEDHPTLTDFRRAQFSISYIAGYIGQNLEFAPWSHDSGYVTALTNHGQGRAYIQLSGGAHTQGARLLVAPGEGLQVSLRAKTDADTNSYNYSWLIDGQPVATNNAVVSHPFTSPGTYSVTAYAAYWDGVDTISTSVRIYDASISGPTNVRPFAICSWSAYTNGGLSPYSYAWSGPGATSGTGEWFDYQNGVPSGGSFTLSLNVTDAGGLTIPLNKTITVSSSAPPCAY